MIDGEKVREGIVFCLSRFHCGEGCPYYSTGKTGCMESLQKDTLELLKEQEPRLMTLEEVKNHNNKDNCVWFELRDIVVIPVFARQDRQETVIENPCILSDQTIPHLYWKNIDYCKKWRCWNFKPADRQRRAVKWDE